MLAEYAKVPPKERFDGMVRAGFIDREGRVTKLIGGDAELDPSASEEAHKACAGL